MQIILRIVHLMKRKKSIKVSNLYLTYRIISVNRLKYCQLMHIQGKILSNIPILISFALILLLFSLILIGSRKAITFLGLPQIKLLVMESWKEQEWPSSCSPGTTSCKTTKSGKTLSQISLNILGTTLPSSSRKPWQLTATFWSKKVVFAKLRAT